MNLYIMRHGPAEDAASSHRDFDRALTPSGRDRVRDVARVLVAEGEIPWLIVSSPLVRALQTAEIVATVTKLSERGGRIDIRRELAAGTSARGLVTELVREKTSSHVMLVGHEPDLATLVADLSGHVVPLGFQKAMVVGLHADRSADPETDAEELKSPSSACGMRLRFVLDPRALVLAPDARALVSERSSF